MKGAETDLRHVDSTCSDNLNRPASIDTVRSQVLCCRRAECKNCPLADGHARAHIGHGSDPCTIAERDRRNDQIE
jgi:hypothetical protein